MALAALALVTATPINGSTFWNERCFPDLNLLRPVYSAQLTHLEGYQYSLFAPNSQALKDAKTFIENILEEGAPPELEFGCIYTAKIVEIKDAGVLITLYDGMSPQFVPNSQLDLRKVSSFKLVFLTLI